MKHLYLIGKQMPVCGMNFVKGPIATEYRPGELCGLCRMWQQRRCAELVRKYKRGDEVA